MPSEIYFGPSYPLVPARRSLRSQIEQKRIPTKRSGTSFDIRFLAALPTIVWPLVGSEKRADYRRRSPRDVAAAGRSQWFSTGKRSVGSRAGMRSPNGYARIAPTRPFPRSRAPATCRGRRCRGRRIGPELFPHGCRLRRSSPVRVDRASGRAHRPGAARRRVSGLGTRQGPAAGRPSGRPRRPGRRGPVRGRGDGGPAHQEARRQRRKEPGGDPRRTIHSRAAWRAGRPRPGGTRRPPGARFDRI